MRRSALAEVIARRSGAEINRVNALLQRVAEDGLLPKGRGHVAPDLMPAQAAICIIAAIADRGIANAPATVRAFSRLRAGNETFADALAHLLGSGDALCGAVTGCLSMQLFPASAALITGDLHRQFGETPSDRKAGKAAIVPGQVLAAIGLEYQGKTPHEADTLIALAQVTRSATLHQAFEAVPA